MGVIYPSPDLIKDWKEWARRLIQVLKSQAQSTFSANNISFSNLSGGECKVSSKAVSSTCVVLLTPLTTPLGIIYEEKASRVNGVSFLIKSTDPNDTPDVAWFIVEPA